MDGEDQQQPPADGEVAPADQPVADMEGMEGDMEGMDGEMDGDMGGMDDMEGMDGMDGDMDGMDDDAPVVDMEGQASEGHAAEDQLDYSKDPRIQWMLKYLEDLMNYNPEEEATAPTNERLSRFYHFLEKPDYSKFFVWVDFENPELLTDFYKAPLFYEADPKPKVQDYQVIYFIKRKLNEKITMNNIEQILIASLCDGDPLDQLLSTMNEACPKLLGETDWPDNVKKEFVAHLHNFMAVITEASYVQKGMQNLYIPNEDLSDIDTAIKDKDLLQRLESIVIFWTRQIKELVSNQDSSQSSHDNSNPLDEIKRWNERQKNLQVLKLRLDEPKLIKIIQVLQKVDSSYLDGFTDLKNQIQTSYEEASSNLKFLKILEDPCRKIQKAQPSEIPALIPDVLSAVRVIWELSDKYATPERMKGLLSKIQNQINQRCRQKIDKEDMLGRDVEKCMRDLDESIDCCNQWRSICQKLQDRIKRRSSKPGWEPDEAIFAENEAFIGRLEQLKEICEGQLQFAQRGASCQMPVFGGSKGKEWKLSLEDLKKMFDKQLEGIKKLDYDILDVKITCWHDDYGQNFKDNVKNIEIIYQTIISKTFNHVSTIEEAVEMLENFYQLARRPDIIRFVQKKGAEQVYQLFIQEIKEVEDLFENSFKKRPVMPISHPEYGGMAIFMHSLICRIDRAKDALEGMYFVPHSQSKDEAESKYLKLKARLDEQIQTALYEVWTKKIEDIYQDQKQLDAALAKQILIKTTPELIESQNSASPFLVRNSLFAKSRKVGLLESNFDSDLRKILIEVNYWNKVQQHGFVNLHINLIKMHHRREGLRLLQENVMLIVRDYNHIMNLISDKEKLLFQEHLKYLDQHIKAGLTKLQWVNNADAFVHTCRGSCRDTLRKIKSFQDHDSQIRDEFDKLSATILTNVIKRMYKLTEFNDIQNKELEKKKQLFQDSFAKIRSLLIQTYKELFMDHDASVQREWINTMRELDRSLEKSLKSSVKSTLLDFQHHIKGDQQEIVPIFTVETVLDTNQDNWKVLHVPNHATLKEDIERLLHSIVKVTSVVPKIEGIFRSDRQKILDEYLQMIDDADKARTQTNMPIAVSQIMNKVYGNNYANWSQEERQTAWEKKFALPASKGSELEYYDKIRKASEIIQIKESINQVVNAIETKMDEDCKTWSLSHEIKHLSSMRTHRGQMRFLKNTQHSGDNVDDAVAKYRSGIEALYEIVEDVRHNRPSSRPEQFIVFLASNLKTELVEQGHQSITSIFGNLMTESKRELHDFIAELRNTIEELTQHPQQKEQFKKNQDKWQEVNNRKPQLQAKIEPLRKKFEFILDDTYSDLGTDQFEMTDADRELLANLDQEWKNFLTGMAEAKNVIHKAQQMFKEDMEEKMEEFKREVQENREKFNLQAPKKLTKDFEDFNNKKAFEQIEQFKIDCQNLRVKEEEMQIGLEIFQMGAENYEELTKVEKENDSLLNIWKIKQEWDNNWTKWEVINFYKLDMREMEDTCQEIQFKVQGLTKEEKKWHVTETLNDRIYTFLNTIPLLSWLSDESMRDRHWKELQLEIKEEFNWHDEDFNLKKVASLNLLQHQDKIEEITSHAKSQLKIEKSLDQIEELWERSPSTNLEIEVTQTKGSSDQCYKIATTENILNLSEEHQQKLGEHKSSPFYKQFDDKIDFWENNIAKITETLEILTLVQERWQYLESIFGGQQHIQKQLAQEYTTFKNVDSTFRSEMLRIYKVKNAYRALVEDARDFIAVLNNLNKHLETIQKKLNDLLAAKRGNFPRFYFLSNEDLLELIGQAKNPIVINKHIKKIYEGITKIIVDGTTQNKGQKEFFITHVEAEDGEQLPMQSDSQAQQIELTTNVQDWMRLLTHTSKQSLEQAFANYARDAPPQQGRKNFDRDRMTSNIHQNIGQILLTFNQIEWTQAVKTALAQLGPDAGVNQNPLKKLRQIYRKKIDTYIQVVEQRSDKLKERDRKKVEAMIILEEHNRDVVDQLIGNKSIHAEHFSWKSQLRYDKETEGNENMMRIICSQLNFERDYGYEYQGNNGRLVVTSLTDKAYMTLTNALALFKGGAPQGPAGTGKTETVKDLGKNLAYFVVIQNCSEQMDHNSLGTNFCGLAMEGAWGCFDEFNRITLDVLSVITTMIKDILDSIKKGKVSDAQVHIADSSFYAESTTGLFITMNPGYAGRTELPDNLASLFRPVAMMVPEFFMIAKNILMSKGFQKNEELSKKICTVYDLMQRQLSRQDFYDFSTRAVKSCVLACGNIKRQEPNQDEVKIVLKAIRDMNLPKLVFEDVSLFDNLFMDLFPEIEEPEIDNDALQIAIEQTMLKRGLQLDEGIVVKCMQLRECKATRHGNMLIGQTMSGKTTCWDILQEALNRLNKGEDGPAAIKLNQPPVKVEVLNPKSINVDELYGAFDDQSPPQWREGVLAKVLKRMVSAETDISRWMVIDGPVDTLWIESMNSVLDDSMRLTLVNCDVIALTRNVRLLFEVDGLAVASPATVSRVGMVYLDIEELGWKPVIRSWLAHKEEYGKEFQHHLSETAFRYLDKVLTTKRTSCKELVVSSESACVRNLCNLYDALEDQWFHRKKEMPRDEFNSYTEKWFVFAMIWSIGATIDESSRRELDIVIRDIEPMFPTTNTVFDYYINTKKGDWSSWDEMLQKNQAQMLSGKEFHEIYIQTVDWARNRAVSQALLNKNKHILFVGNSGVGKTVLIEKTLLAELNQLELSFTINFSAGTSSNRTQEVIESNFDRRAKNKFKPKNTKLKAVCFIDDLNMPKKDTFGSQPPIELLRQWCDTGFWYDREKIEKNYMCDLQILAAMGKPGGGRAQITPRLTSKFHLINFTNPNERAMKKIYDTIFMIKFTQFGDDVKVLQDTLALATINIFNQCMADFLPTPKKTHYIYNMRDISKVFQGLFLADKNYYESKEQVVKLWAHEVFRVFHDRLISIEDTDKFRRMVNFQLEQQFQMEYIEHCMTNQERDPTFVDFLVEDDEMKVYEEVTDFKKLREFLNGKLDAFNSQKKVQPMDIVLFTDAIIHISRIYRVLNLKRGHALLVGVGGSGRHSLTKLSAYISTMSFDQLEMRKGFGLKDFRAKLMDLYEQAAYRGVPGNKAKLKTVFIFSDNDVVYESFLEDIQNMLNSGIVPNIYPAEELGRVRDEMKIPYKHFCARNGLPFLEQPEVMNDWFYDRVKDNMHLSLCMSPIGERFREYTRNFPALINNTAIDWFMAWPEEALIEVAKKYIYRIDIDDEFKDRLAQQCGYSFAQAQVFADKMYNEVRRIFYVTPTNYIELLKGLKSILKGKRDEIGKQANKLRNGLGRLAGAGAQVTEMTAESEIKRAEVSKKQQECADLKINLAKQEKEATEKQKAIEIKTESVNKERVKAEALAREANDDLAKTMPILEAANEAVGNLTNKDIGEVRAYATPPKDIQNVMSAVMTVLGKPNADWASVKKEMTDPKFMKRITDLDKNNMSEATMRRIEAYTKKDNFLPQILMQKSLVAGALCGWVRAVEEYHKALKIVRPKIKKKEDAEALLQTLQEQLQSMEDEFAILAAKLKELSAQLTKTTEEMEAFKADLEQLQARIERGDRLITGLADEKERWEETLLTLDEQYYNLVGDVALAAAFMSLCGPFPADYREDMNALWMKKVQELELPHDPNYEFCEFLGSKAQIKRWQQDGLPIDKFSTENGVCITKGDRWALSIDPQTQANNWIKKMVGKKLQVLDVNDKDLLRKMSKCVKMGQTVLLQDVLEVLDPSLDNLLNKATIKLGNELMMKLGDGEITYNKKFQLYITTRMSNPHYTPEVSTKVNVINFSIKEQGLEEQCLGIVVEEEQPALEANKNTLVDKIESGQAELKRLEDDILTRLQEAKIALLENVALIQALQNAKETQENVQQQLESSSGAMKKINETRDQYRSCGRVAAALFFVLLDLYKINPMYQFSLTWYRDIFKMSIADAKNNPGQQDEKINTIIKCHILNVYRFTCRSLFERHKLLLSFQLAIKMQQSAGNINREEYLFFLRGAVGLADKSIAPGRPNADWIQESAWNNLIELDQTVDNFSGICQAIQLSTKEWKNWYSSKKPEPEEAQLPGEWETKCEDPLRKMIVLRCFRPDRVIFAVKNYILQCLKSQEFITSKSTQISDIYKDSMPSTPIIIVLTQGVDPTDIIDKFAEEQEVKIDAISLGKGQSKKAIDSIDKAAKDGNWCFLSNCHLSVSMLPELEAKLDKTALDDGTLDTFRLILSASPTDNFPISLLQRSVKMTMEPPRGIKPNMLRLYRNIGQAFTHVDKEQQFRKAIFGLCWFHTLLLERKKFKSLGWNSNYPFNDSDWQVCADTLANEMGRMKDGQPIPGYMRKAPIPWQAITYLISKANYGGRVTDDMDIRLLDVYAGEIFNDELVMPEKWRPADPKYQYPADEANVKSSQDQALLFTPEHFIGEITNNFPNDDLPEAYGQHTNAEINSQTIDSLELLDAVLSLQSAASSGASNTEAKVLEEIATLRGSFPEEVINLAALKHKLSRGDSDPLNIVLVQEVQRYNHLMTIIKSTLTQLELGIMGLDLITPELEKMMGNFQENKVPEMWAFAYFSTKSLSNWKEDLCKRYDFFKSWVTQGQPLAFWIGAFTFPTGFTTSLQQRFSRKKDSPPIDKLEFDFIPQQRKVEELGEGPKDGAYIYGLFLEGGKWDDEKQCLCEPEVMELYVLMPVIWFKPISRRGKALTSVYECPCYYYPIRKGSVDRASFMLKVDLKLGDSPSEHWIKRGTALLMSTGT